MKRVLTVLFLAISLTGYSQSKKLWLYNADNYFKVKDYASALTYYLKVLDDTSIREIKVYPYETELVNQKLKTNKKELEKTKQVPLEHYVRHRIALCYQRTFDYSHAKSAFQTSLANNSYPEDQYLLAYSMMQLKEFEPAVLEFEKYLTHPQKTDSLSKAAQRDMVGCYFALDIANTKPNVIIKMADTATVNKGTSNFAAMYWGGTHKLVFTSAREGGVLIDPEKQQSEYICDLWWTEKESDTSYSVPQNFGRPVNTALHEAAGLFTIDELLFFTRWSDNKRDEQYICMAKMMNGLFFEAYKIDTSVNVKGYKSVQPFVSMDGTQLFFSSNRPGGFGGMDIWVCALDENGKPGKAKNLGPSINTEYDEVTPFVHAISSTLYFSSNGHNSTGGLDIYKSYYDIDAEVYNTAVNLGLPFNSTKDDAYFIADRFIKTGYFSSDREDCPTGHCYDIYEFKNSDIEFNLSGYAYNQETGDILPNVLLTFSDVNGNDEVFFISTDDDGFYKTPLKQEQELFIKAKKNKYFADAAVVNTYGLTESTSLIQDFELRPIPTDEIDIEGIEYDYDKATLRPKSKEVLDKLYDFLVLNDNLTVEIQSYTDCRGNDAYNMRLSQARAKSCVDYLVSKGIARERLIPKGFGETEPLFICEDIEAFKKTDKAKFEEMHQRNRRTAFKVTSEGN